MWMCFHPCRHADKVVIFNQTVIPVWLLLVGEPIGDVRVGDDGAPSWDTRVSTIGFTSLQVFDNWNSKVYIVSVLLLTNLCISIQLTNNYSVVVVVGFLFCFFFALIKDHGSLIIFFNLLEGHYRPLKNHGGIPLLHMQTEILKWVHIQVYQSQCTPTPTLFLMEEAVWWVLERLPICHLPC